VAYHSSRWNRFEADNGWQVKRAGSEPATVRARVHIVGLRARGWRGHDGVEVEGFASYPISNVSRTVVLGTYLPRSLRPFGEHLRRVVVHAKVRGADAQGCAGRLEEDDDDAD